MRGDAPNAIFTVQTMGDLATGTFSPVDPRINRWFLLAKDERIVLNLREFTTYPEATHWSGVKMGVPGNRLGDLKASQSTLRSAARWATPLAARVLARSLFAHFDVRQSLYNPRPIPAAFIQPAFRKASLESREGVPIAASHVLPTNGWYRTNMIGRAYWTT